MDYPKISVVMPVYNEEKYIGESIDSILSQSYTDFEFIIINDASTDRSLEIINQYKELFKIDNVELIFDDAALEAIVEKAEERKIGARALRSVIEETMIEIMYDIPSKKNLKSCKITKRTIIEKIKPKLHYYKKTA